VRLISFCVASRARYSSLKSLRPGDISLRGIEEPLVDYLVYPLPETLIIVPLLLQDASALIEVLAGLSVSLTLLNEARLSPLSIAFGSGLADILTLFLDTVSCDAELKLASTKGKHEAVDVLR